MIYSYFSDNFNKRFIKDEFNTKLELYCVGGTTLVGTIAEDALCKTHCNGKPCDYFFSSRH